MERRGRARRMRRKSKIVRTPGCEVFAEMRTICPMCHCARAHREEHPDCVAAARIKNAATAIITLFRKGKIYLRDARREFKKLKSQYSPKKIKEVGLDFYNALIKQYNAGALAGASVEEIIRPFTKGLSQIAACIRKTRVFQGNVCLVPE